MTPDAEDAGAQDRPSVGALLVRAWLHDQTLIARVSRTPDVHAVAPVTVVVTGPRQLHYEVTRWLIDLGVEEEDPASEAE